MNKKNYLMSAVLVGLLSGCAGLMMKVSDVDPSHADLRLETGNSVKIDRSSIEKSFQRLGENSSSSKALTDQLLGYLEQDLKDKNISIASSSSQDLKLDITGYRKGCGICRGFFPVFGLGNSYVNANVDLSTSKGTRKLIIEKTGQSSGIGTMGDQTPQNLQYLSTVIVNNLVLSRDIASTQKK